jgi:hypothetical protein
MNMPGIKKHAMLCLFYFFLMAFMAHAGFIEIREPSHLAASLKPKFSTAHIHDRYWEQNPTVLTRSEYHYTYSNYTVLAGEHTRQRWIER